MKEQLNSTVLTSLEFFTPQKEIHPRGRPFKTVYTVSRGSRSHTFPVIMLHHFHVATQIRKISLLNRLYQIRLVFYNNEPFDDN